MHLIRFRLVHYYPQMAASIPVREICGVAADAGAAILAASQKHGRARQTAFTQLIQRWRDVPPDIAPTGIASGQATLRYASYSEPHEDHQVPRHGSVVLVAAVPEVNPEAPWCLAGEEFTEPIRFHIAATAFQRVEEIRRNGGVLTVRDLLVEAENSTDAGHR